MTNDDSPSIPYVLNGWPISELKNEYDYSYIVFIEI